MNLFHLAQDVLDYGFMYKNEEHFNNDFLTGTPDVNTDSILLDVKSSYDATTFPFFAEDIPNQRLLLPTARLYGTL